MSGGTCTCARSCAAGATDARIRTLLKLIGRDQPFPADGGAPYHGVGLRTAVAGEPTSILLRFRDEFGNPASPGSGEHFHVGMAIHPRREDSKHGDFKVRVEQLAPVPNVERRGSMQAVG